jgi:hypothetical protein
VRYSGFAQFSPLLTVTRCCAQRKREPSWQGSVLCVDFHFLGRHPLEKFVEAYVLTSVYPLTGCIDLCVRLNRSHHGRCCDLYLSGTLDNLFESGANITLSLGKKANRVCVSVYR